MIEFLVFAVPGLLALVAVLSLAFVGTKMFQHGNRALAIGGMLLCPIIPFVWGWRNVDLQNLRRVMRIWTAAIIVGIGGILFVLSLSPLDY